MKRKKKEKLKERKGSGLALSGENLIKPLSGCVCEKRRKQKVNREVRNVRKKKLMRRFYLINFMEANYFKTRID